MTEEWRDIPGYEGFYQASSTGLIRSLDRAHTWTGVHGQTVVRIIKSKLRRAHINPSGYFTLHLNKHGGRKLYTVHQLIALSFHGPRPAGFDTCHNNGSETDNRPENLRYAPRKNNIADKKLHGTALMGERHLLSKLTEASAIAIYQARGSTPASRLACSYGVSATTILSVWHGRTWSQVTGAKNV